MLSSLYIGYLMALIRRKYVVWADDMFARIIVTIGCLVWKIKKLEENKK